MLFIGNFQLSGKDKSDEIEKSAGSTYKLSEYTTTYRYHILSRHKLLHRNLMSVMREQLLNSRTVRLEGLGTFTMIAKAGGKGVVLESKVSSSQIVSLRCQFTPEYTRSADGVTTRALTSGVEFVHVKDVAGGFVDDDDKNHSGGGDTPGGGSTPGGDDDEAPDPTV